MLFPRQPTGSSACGQQRWEVRSRCPIPHAVCRQPWSHQWELLSCDAPVSICLCPLIRDLIYSQRSPCKSAERGSTHYVSLIINLSNFHNAVLLESDPCCLCIRIPCYMEESVAHAVSQDALMHLWSGSAMVYVLKVVPGAYQEQLIVSVWNVFTYFHFHVFSWRLCYSFFTISLIEVRWYKETFYFSSWL